MAGDIKLNIDCVGLINGQHCTVRGRGKGNIERGLLEMTLTFSNVPVGFSVLAAAHWTACCSSPTFALERNGGYNMLSIAGANYRCIRTYDIGSYGSYEYYYEDRLKGDTMTATGIIQGNLRLPPLKGARERISEIMVPVGREEIRSFTRGTVIEANDDEVPVNITGRYTPLVEGDPNWMCCVRDQARTSLITITNLTDLEVSLEYRTVVQGIDFPEFPQQVRELAAAGA